MHRLYNYSPGSVNFEIFRYETQINLQTVAPKFEKIFMFSEINGPKTSVDRTATKIENIDIESYIPATDPL